MSHPANDKIIDCLRDQLEENKEDKKRRKEIETLIKDSYCSLSENKLK